MHEDPTIPHQTLRLLLRGHYALDVASAGFLPIGDTHTAVYRVATRDSRDFFLKLRPSPIYEPSLHAPRFLHDHDIDAVIAPIPTNTSALSATIDRWTAVLFPYVQGDTGWATITGNQWRETGRIFRQIHALGQPTPGIDGIRREAFDPSLYSSDVDALKEHLAARAEPGSSLQTLDGAWTKHQTTISAILDSMHNLATALKLQALPNVIAHADLHPGNLLRDPSGRVLVIDWDDVMLAPKERDFIFTGEPGDATQPGSPFFDGYGPADINWTAITYYRYERVITDLIEYARDVFRELSDATKAHSVESFIQTLEGPNFAAAQTAAAHLP